jgi:hypothetical protein
MKSTFLTRPRQVEEVVRIAFGYGNYDLRSATVTTTRVRSSPKKTRLIPVF